MQEQAKAGYLTFEETRTTVSPCHYPLVGYEREVKIDVTTFPCSWAIASRLQRRPVARWRARMSEVLATLVPRRPSRWSISPTKGGDDNVSVVVAYAANVG